jgi:hypothetical protein
MPVTAKKSKLESLEIHPVPSIQDKPVVKNGSQALLYAFTILLSAFLLFQVELIMGKFLLPRFGGGPSVWTTSMLVFQILLLAGYAYAAFCSARLTPRQQGITHICLLAVSGLIMAALAFTAGSTIFPGNRPPQATEYPVWHISLLLLTSVGIQCILLSATGPLLQHWFSRSHSGSPYRLYALSNLGSMLGLLGYPLVVERVMTLSAQARLWTAGYVLFSLGVIACAFFSMRVKSLPTDAEPEQTKRKTKKRNKIAERQPRILWLTLAACSCTMLLATTNVICQETASIPLLWVVPLALYLLSFIICFDHARWYRRGLFYPFYLFWALLALRVLPVYGELPVISLVVIYNAALMAVCMVCHGELACLKPETQHLTSFYLLISAGGALGSAAVVLLAPQIFDRIWEFQIALVGCGVLAAVTTLRDPNSWFYTLRFGRVLFTVALVILLAGSGYFTYQLVTWQGDMSTVLLMRNFFGLKTIVRDSEGLQLIHGNTEHGMQFSEPTQSRTPTLYYANDSGIGLLLDHYQCPIGRGMRVGVIGMGVGTLAAYGKDGDYFRFYEIDPAIPRLSLGTNPLFTFVKDSPAHIDVVLGDARIKMQEEVSRREFQDFDVLVVDAFSGDTIPVHLLTREAMDLYLRQLHGPQSIVAFHITNRSLDLSPVVATLANSVHLASVEVDTASSSWVLLSRDGNVFRQPDLAASAQPIEVSHPMRLWTDDYSSVFNIFRW